MEQKLKSENQNSENKQHSLRNTTCINETKSRQQKPKPMKQKFNRKNQNQIIIAENKNGNFKYLSIKKTKPRLDMENT